MVIIKQASRGLLTIWLALTIAFIGLRLLPGNAISAQLQGSGLPQTTIDARVAAIGYNQPIVNQYGHYLMGILTGDWGQSLYTGQTVSEAMSNRLSSTANLAFYSISLAIILGIILGFLAGLPNAIRWLAQLLVNLSLSIPIYVTATILLFVIAARIGGTQQNLLLPVITLGFHSSGAIARVIATNIQQVQQSDYIRTAYAKGLPTNAILRRHMLPLVIIPTISIIGLQSGILLSGAVITETIFGRAGLGLLLLDATLQRDYPIVQGIVALAALIYVIINQLADTLIMFIDPRLNQS
ncbi:MAG: ABC transporter permease [Phototrophicaceae bacterium]